MKNRKLSIAYAAFFTYLIIGTYGVHSVDYIEANRAMWSSFPWSLILPLVGGMYFGYLSIVTVITKYNTFRKMFVFIVTTFAFTLFSFSCMHGYTILYNCHIGKQTKTVVKGTIVSVHIPRPKKWLNDYSIKIEKNDSKEIIELVVPTRGYIVGEPFEKEMMIGSLGFIYKD